MHLQWKAVHLQMSWRPRPSCPKTQRPRRSWWCVLMQVWESWDCSKGWLPTAYHQTSHPELLSTFKDRQRYSRCMIQIDHMREAGHKKWNVGITVVSPSLSSCQYPPRPQHQVLRLCQSAQRRAHWMNVNTEERLSSLIWDLKYSPKSKMTRKYLQEFLGYLAVITQFDSQPKYACLNKPVGHLRTELVLNRHSVWRFFPSTNTTPFPVTSSRLGVSSVSPVLSTCFTESDLQNRNKC